MRKPKAAFLTALALIVFLSAAVLLQRLLSTRYPDAVPVEQDAAADSGDVYAPDFTMLDADGDTVALSDFLGTPVVMNFWATWCPPCREELPYFNEAFGEYGERVAFLMTDVTDGQRETVENVRAFLTEQGYVFPVYYDTELKGAYAYGVSAIPATYFIGADGVVRAYQIGALNRELLYDQLEKLLE